MYAVSFISFNKRPSYVLGKKILRTKLLRGIYCSMKKESLTCEKLITLALTIFMKQL